MINSVMLVITYGQCAFKASRFTQSETSASKIIQTLEKLNIPTVYPEVIENFYRQELEPTCHLLNGNHFENRSASSMEISPSLQCHHSFKITIYS